MIAIIFIIQIYTKNFQLKLNLVSTVVCHNFILLYIYFTMYIMLTPILKIPTLNYTEKN